MAKPPRMTLLECPPRRRANQPSPAGDQAKPTRGKNSVLSQLYSGLPPLTGPDLLSTTSVVSLVPLFMAATRFLKIWPSEIVGWTSNPLVSYGGRHRL